MEGHFCTNGDWAWGLIISLLVGGVVVLPVLWGLRWLGRLDQTWDWRLICFGFVFGFIERGAITLVGAYDLEKAAAFSVVWLGLKLASGWNRPQRGMLDDKQGHILARNSFVALCGSLISVGFALAGAMVICGKL